MLCPLSEVFEKVLAERIKKHMAGEGLYYQHQYGFRSGHLTESQLLHLTHRMSQAISTKTEAEMILLDCTNSIRQNSS